jgi:hypothetical protein
LKDVDSIISDLEQQRSAIERAIAALREIGGAPAPQPRKVGRPVGSGKAVAKKTRRLSPEGRKRIIEALKKRWAEKKAAEKSSARKARGKKAAKKTAEAAS